MTDDEILEKALVLGRGGSTAVTAILINGEKLVVANLGDSRAVICKNGVAKQLSVDHEPSREKRLIESRGGFVSNLPGNKLSRIITKEESFSFFILGRLK
jgi:protein phosphatase 1L